MRRPQAVKSRVGAVLGLLALSVLLSSCGSFPFCRVETYSYRPMVPIYLQPDEIAKIESGPPQAITAPGKIYLHGELIFVGEAEGGVHVIDNRNPRDPVPVAFISVPGVHDLLVREDASGTVLYADNYNDLVALDISNPLEVKVLKRLEGVFSAFYPQDEAEPGKGFLVGYEEGDPVTERYRSCGEVVHSPPPVSGPAPSPGAPGVSQGGSLARFAALEDFLYTVDGDAVQSFRLRTLADPVPFNRITVDFGIETLFPYRRASGDQLYVGGNNGLYIMDASRPGELRKEGELSHVQSCDPVVVQEDLAYVTLQGSCFGQSNRLEIIDVSDSSAPRLITDYAMQEPYGLGVDGDFLFVCDGAAGLKVYGNARRPKDLELITQLGEVNARDVIPFGGVALVVAENGLFQYDYSALAQGEMTLLSSIPVASE